MGREGLHPGGVHRWRNLDLPLGGEAKPGRMYIGSTKIFREGAENAPTLLYKFLPFMEVSEVTGRVPKAAGTHLSVEKLKGYPQFQHLTGTFGRISYSNVPTMTQAASQLGFEKAGVVGGR